MRPGTSAAHWPACGVLLAVFLCIGCGGGGSKSSVSGRVTLNGAAIESGSMLFVPIDGTPGGTAGAAITAGSYAVPNGLVPGTYRVEVRAPRPSAKRIPKPFAAPGEMIAATEEAVAEEFNDRSTLVLALEPGPNTMSVDVTPRGVSKPAD